MLRARRNNLKAVILAAGKGTRMGALTEDTPKAMIRVAGKPVLEHIIRRMVAAGVSDFVLVTRHLAEQIEAYFGNGSLLGARIGYVEQTEGYGTGAALLSAKALADDQPLMLTFADVIVSTQTYASVIDAFSDTCGAGIAALNWVDDPCSGAAVVVDEAGRIERIVEKPPKGGCVSNWNSAGVFVFDPLIFGYLEALSPSWRGEYELADALNAMIADGLAVYPSYLKGDWLDVGTVEALAVAEKMLG